MHCACRHRVDLHRLSSTQDVHAWLGVTHLHVYSPHVQRAADSCCLIRPTLRLPPRAAPIRLGPAAGIARMRGPATLPRGATAASSARHGRRRHLPRDDIHVELLSRRRAEAASSLVSAYARAMVQDLPSTYARAMPRSRCRCCCHSRCCCCCCCCCRRPQEPPPAAHWPVARAHLRLKSSMPSRATAVAGSCHTANHSSGCHTRRARASYMATLPCRTRVKADAACII